MIDATTKRSEFATFSLWRFWLQGSLILGGIALAILLTLHTREVFERLARPSGLVPIVAMGLGSVVGLGWLIVRRAWREFPRLGAALLGSASMVLHVGAAVPLVRESALAFPVIAAAGGGWIWWRWLRGGSGQELLAVAILFISANPFQGEPMYPWAFADVLALVGVGWWLAGTDRRESPLDLPLGALTLALIASTALGVYPYAGVKVLGVLGRYLAVYLLISSVADRPDARQSLLVSVTGPLVVVAAGMISRVGERIATLGWASGLSFRVWVLDSPPNYIAFVIVPVILALAVAPWRGWRRVVHPLLIALLGLAVFFTYARISYLALLAGGGVLLAVRLLGRRAKLPLGRIAIATGSGLVVVALSLSLAPDGIQHRMAEMLRPTDDPRFRIWRVATPMMVEYPLTGPGPQTKRYLLDLYAGREEFGTPGPYRKDIHNLFMEVATANGVIGTFALWWVLVSWAGAGVVLVRRRRGSSFLGTFLLAGLAAVMVDGVANFRLWIPENGVIIFAILGLARGLLPSVGGRGAAVGLAVVAGVLLVPRGLEHLATAEMRRGQALVATSPPAARSAFERAAALEPLNAHHRFLLATWERNFGDPPRAIAHYESAIARSPFAAVYHAALGEMLLEGGRFDLAVAPLRRAHEIQPYDLTGRYRFLYGQALFLTGQREASLPHLYMGLLTRTGRHDDPIFRRHPSLFWDAMGVLYTDFARPTDLGYPAPDHVHHAAWLFEDAEEESPFDGFEAWGLTAYPESPDVAILCARSRMRRWDFVGARQLLCVAEERTEPTSVLLNEFGMWHFLQGEYAAATEHFEEANAIRTSLVQDNFLAVSMLVRCHERLGDTKEAAAWQARRDYVARDWERQRWEAQFHQGGYDHPIRQAEGWLRWLERHELR